MTPPGPRFEAPCSTGTVALVAAALLAGCKLPALPAPPGPNWRLPEAIRASRIAFAPTSPAAAPVAAAGAPAGQAAGDATDGDPRDPEAGDPAGAAPPAGPDAPAAGAPGPVGGPPPPRRGGGGSGGGGRGGAPAVPPPPIGFVPAERGAWRVGPALVRPRAGLAAGAVGGRLLALEGDHTGSYERLAADGSAWERLPTIAANGSDEALPGRLLGAVAGAPDALLLVGGTAGTALGMPVRYGADAAPELTYHDLEPVQAPAAGLVGDRLYVAGGFRVGADGRVQVATGGVRRLGADGSADGGAAPPDAVAGAAGVVLDGRFYMLGGFQVVDGEPRPVRRVQVYDPVLDRWKRDGTDLDLPAALPIPLAFAGAAVLDGRIYVAGGRNDTGQPSARAWSYDPATRLWRELAPMPTGRVMLGLAAHAGRVWAIGGLGEGEKPCTTVEVFTP